MKKPVLLLICIVLTTLTAWSQTHVFVGDTTGSSSYYYGPIYRSSAGSSYNYCTYGLLYEASDLTLPSGTSINKIAFKKANNGTLTGGVCDVTIRMKNSSTTSYSSPLTYATLTGATYTVVYASLTDSFTSGADTWHEWTLSTPFNYTGGSLEVSIDFNRDGATSNGSVTWYYENATGKSVGFATSSAPTGIAQTSGSYSNKTLATRFDVTYPAGACLPPSNLGISNITSTSADAAWTSGGAANAYVEYGAPGFTPGSGTGIYVSGTSTAISGLSPNTTYDVYVKDSCATNSSTFVGPITFRTLCAAQVSGAITINPSLPASATNYTSFWALSQELSNCGVSGPVSVTVAPGAYTDSMDIGEIIGASATNTIVIDGGSTSSVSITHAAASTNATILLDGADYVTLKNLTIANTKSAADAWGIMLTNSADFVTIENCIINMEPSTGPDIAGIVASGSLIASSTGGDNAHNLTIANCTVNEGYYGYRHEGGNIAASSPELDSALSITNCQFINNGGYGIYMDDVVDVHIANNTIGGTGNSTKDGMYLSDINDFVIEKNNVLAPDYGLYIFDANFEATPPTSRSKIVNNMLYSTEDEALRVDDLEMVDIIFNSIKTDGTATAAEAFATNDIADVSIINNIFFANAGEAFYSSDATSTFSNVDIDYNIYFSNTGDIGYLGSGNTYSSLTAWQTADATLNVNSLEGDPIFANVNDLHLVGGLANNAGDNTTGITDDIDGDMRSAATPDIGADEYSPASCLPSTALGATNITATSANVYWTSSNPTSDFVVEYGATGYTPGQGTSIPTTNDTVLISGLTANTNYDFYVKDSCSTTSVSLWAGPYTFKTLCTNISTFPYTEGFEGSSWTIPTSNCSYTDGIDGCWSRLPNGYASAMSWIMRTGSTCSGSTGPNYAHTGDNYTQLETSSSGSDATLTLPPLDLSSLSNPEISFYYHMYGTTIGELYVEASADGGTSWTVLDSLVGQQQTSSSDAWMEKSVSLSGYSGNVLIQFRGTYGGSYTGDIALDDIAVGEAPSCATPTMLGATNITAITTDVFWTTGGATDWKVQYGAAGFTLGAGTTQVASNDTLTLSGLTPNTTYDFYVLDSCGVGLVSPWAGPYSFTTMCSSFTAPFVEDFETATGNAGCWSQEYVSGTGDWTFATGSTGGAVTTANSGSLNARFTSSSAGNITKLITPVIDASALSSTQLSFAYAQEDWAGDQNFLNVYYRDSANGAWNAVWSDSTNQAAWTNATVLIPSTSATLQIAFEGVDDYGRANVIDDVEIKQEPSCLPASNLGAMNITTTSADVYWTTGGASNWNIQYGATGFTLGSGTMMNATNDTISLTGLTAASSYDVYVRDSCAVGNVSAWAGPYTFTTLCNVFTAPFVEDFETATGNTGCWSQEYVSGTGDWTFATGSTGGAVTTANSGSLNARFTSSSAGIITKLITPVIDASALTSTQLSFAYAQEDWAGDQNFLNVYYRDSANGAWMYLWSDSTNVAAWTDTTIVVPSTSATLQIAFEGIDDYGRGNVLDDVSVENAAATLNAFNLLSPPNMATVIIGGTPTAQVEISWEEAAPNATYEWRAFAAPATLNQPLVALPSDNNGADTTLTLTMAEIDAILAMLNVNVGDTVSVDWNVKATAGNDSIFGTQSFTINLVRGNLAEPNYVVAPQASNATTSISAPNGVSKYHRASTIVTAADFAGANISANTMLRSFGFSLAAPASGTVQGILKVYLVNTTDASYNNGNVWNNIVPGMTEVYNDTVIISAGDDNYVVQLNQNFEYTGASVYVAHHWELLSAPLTTALNYNSNNLTTSSINRASSSISPPDTLNSTSSFRPTYIWGIDKSADDYEVVALWAKGKNPLNYGSPEEIRVVVKNNGFLETPKTVDLTVAGANSFTASSTVMLGVGKDTTLTFSFGATTAGLNTISASVPMDDLNSNNTKTWLQESTNNTFGYADTAVANQGSLGYNTGSGLLLSRFEMTGSGSVTDVNIRVSANVNNPGNTIYAVLIDTSGTIVSQSANYVIQAADLNSWKTFSMPMPPTLTNQEFYVGIAQTANTVGYYPLGYQPEEPTRENAYYTADLNGSNMNQLQAGFRFMIEAVVSAPAPCADPATLAAAAGCDTASLSWTSAAGATSTIEYGPSGFTPGSGILMQNVSSPTTLMGLTQGTSYDFYVMDSCANGNVSNWVGPVTFTTDTMPNISISATLVTAGNVVNYDFDVTSGASNATTITWDFGDGSSGTGASENHDYTANGTYTVVCVATNDCGSDTATTTALVEGIGIDENLAANVSLYPNPNNGNFTITGITNFGDEATVEVIAVTGIVVYKTNIVASSSESIDIDLTGHAAGIYQVRISSKKGVAVKQFALKR